MQAEAGKIQAKAHTHITLRYSVVQWTFILIIYENKFPSFV